ncbi:MMPL family transporter [Paenibacillus sp. GSMTC-2017]|uniref:MMPL family transporter n=1 Tax=Paenibacillus sp. GSMTC-2017 TaxID=2794350 RepID=UPI0018D64F02|nr:MMPL family transporter [Paenibacillus sp. GSMTC-2017]MBH5316462.1 MMPL family transporter [Paenibacillus sp. GSMTC-2017]
MIEKLGLAFAGPRTRWITLIVWIVAVVLLTLTLPAVGDKEKNNAPNLETDSPSVVADEIIKEHFPNSSGVPALVVWHRVGGLTEADYSLISELSKSLTEVPLKAQGEQVPLHTMGIPLSTLSSKDGTTFVQPVLFAEATETELLKENMEAIKDRVKVASGADPFAVAIESSSELSVRISGPVGISVDATDLFKNADFVLLMATVIIVLVLLLLIYRSPILAIIPLAGVGFAYGVTSPLLGWMAGEGWITVDSQAIAIMTVLLFGAGTDYCLFFITRFRRELTHESNRFTALIEAFKGSSGAIAMSGFTVVISLFALLAAKYGAFERFAVPFSLSILIMMVASLTLVPAIMSIVGRASFYPFIPRTEEMEKQRSEKRGKPFKQKDEEKTLGSKIGNLVVKKPWLVVMSSILLLGLLASFAIGIKYTYDMLSSFPEDMPSREGFNVIADAYTPGDLAPITVVLRTDGKAVDALAKLSGIPHVNSVSEPKVSESDSGLTSYSVVLDINPYSEEAMDTIPLLREAVSEALLLSNVANTEEKVWIGGQTASQYDTRELTIQDNLVIIPLVIGLIMLLLLVYLRSVVATLYLIGTVLLSYVAALGLGWVILHYVMGFDAIQGSIPLYAFVFLIALGEDYNIFMISSIWQKRKHMPLKQAIKEGVSETGGVITSAGLILAATFAVLASLPIQVLLQFGLITALGVLLDTFIVRPFLVPAITTILGKKAFWPSKVDLVSESKQVQNQ